MLPRIGLNILYLLTLVLLSPVIIASGLKKKSFLLSWQERWFGRVPFAARGRQLIWFHAVSVGEVNLLLPIIVELRRRDPNIGFAISATSGSGLRLAKKLFADEIVFRCPLDFSWAIKSALVRLRPDLIVLAELEVWPNWLAISNQQSIPVSIVNGRLSERSLKGYRRLGQWTKDIFKRLELVAAQDQGSAKRFVQAGVSADRVQMLGNIKFDNCSADPFCSEVEALRSKIGLRRSSQSESVFRQDSMASVANVPIWVAGSTQAGEDELVLDAYHQLLLHFPALRLILIPRHPERFETVSRMVDATGLSTANLSRCDQASFNRDWQILVGDTIGELRWIWGLADIAFVGGSFGDRGGQNMIEPAAFGASVAVGPNTKNFHQIVTTFVSANAISQLAEPSELFRWAKAQLSERTIRAKHAASAKRIIANNSGAVVRTCDVLMPFLVRASKCADGQVNKKAA